ncbi:UvrD-helicase domain-containing protein [Candidatus Altiarchaeota archaeon]
MVGELLLVFVFFAFLILLAYLILGIAVYRAWKKDKQQLTAPQQRVGVRLEPEEEPDTSVQEAAAKKQLRKYQALYRELNKLMKENVTSSKTYLTTPKRREITGAIKKVGLAYHDFGDLAQYLPEKKQTWLTNTQKKLLLFQDQLKAYNESFIAKRVKSRIFDPKDDPDQRRAVVVDDKHNLVVAGPGSGKTRVLTRRISYLARRPDKVKPDRILALAFQKEAAKEMKKRASKDAAEDCVKTFHAFGFKVIRDEAGEEAIPDVLDGYQGQHFLNKIIKSLDESNFNFKWSFLHFIVNYLDYPRSKGPEESPEDYYEYMGKMKYTTYKNDRADSQEERLICNFLFENGIELLLHPAAEWVDRMRGHPYYHPDFYLPEYDIYIEHFGIDKDGNVPPWFDISSKGYRAQMKWKRGQFEKHDKKLIETFSYEHSDGVLLENLKKRLDEEGVEFNPLPYEELVEQVYSFKADKKTVTDMVQRFIGLMKSNRMSIDAVREKARGLQLRTRLFVALAINVFEEYERQLEEQNLIDFNDMINNAVDLMRANREYYAGLYDQVLVDEYQDMSKQRMDVLNCLVTPENDTKLFCVGDDCQSIMGFTGSEVEFFTDFEKYFPDPAVSKLENNYRSSKTAVDMANALIEKNTVKISKKIRAISTKEKKAEIYRLPKQTQRGKHYEYDWYRKLYSQHCIDLIKSLLERGAAESQILVMYRYKFVKEELDNLLAEEGLSKVLLSTMHAAKGSEAEYVILLDIASGKYGVPSEITDDEILDLVKANPGAGKLEEERRVFYVAITRSMEELYMYTEKDRESLFLGEIDPFTETIDVDTTELADVIKERESSLGEEGEPRIES